MPRATLLTGEKIRTTASGGPYVRHSSLCNIDGKPGDMMDIYDESGQLITQACYQPLHESDLAELEYLGEVSRLREDWSWFNFYRDQEHDRYYVAKWELCGVDLSGERTSGGWAVPKEDVMKEPSEDYIRRLEGYCRR